jgi:hypothetical protein
MRRFRHEGGGIMDFQHVRRCLCVSARVLMLCARAQRALLQLVARHRAERLAAIDQVTRHAQRRARVSDVRVRASSL